MLIVLEGYIGKGLSRCTLSLLLPSNCAAVPLCTVVDTLILLLLTSFIIAHIFHAQDNMDLFCM